MRTFATVATLIAALFSVSASAATSTTLTFEGQYNAQYDNTTIVRDGYEIGIVSGFEQHFHEITSNDYGLTSNGTGILLVDRPTQLYIKSSDLSDFQLNSFDSSWYSGSGTIKVIGYRDGSEVGNFSIGASMNGWTTQSGLSLGSVDYLVFDGTAQTSGWGQQLDNIKLVAAPVPEPETYALMLAGIGMVGFIRSRRKAV